MQEIHAIGTYMVEEADFLTLKQTIKDGSQLRAVHADKIPT